MDAGSYIIAKPNIRLFNKEVMWGLFTPCNLFCSQCQYLSNFVLQRLMREIDGFPSVYYLNLPVMQSSETIDKSGNNTYNIVLLTRKLNSWKCDNQALFFQCYIDLWQYVFNEGIIELSTKSFLHPLLLSNHTKSFNVVEPKRVKEDHHCKLLSKEHRVHLGKVNPRLRPKDEKYPNTSKNMFVANVQKRCSGYNEAVWAELSETEWINSSVKDILLIVVFNTNKFFWNNLDYLETLHRPFFRYGSLIKIYILRLFMFSYRMTITEFL